YYGQHPAEAEGITGDTALFRYVATQLPIGLPGLIISAMLAAVMSTLDSGMNSLAAVATKDIYIQYFRRDASERQQVAFSRIMTVVVGLFAITVAMIIASVAESIKESIMEAYTIWGAVSVVLVPVFLLGVTTRRVNSFHIVVSCMVAWLVTAGMVLWYVLSKGTDHEVSFMVVAVPGVVVMLIIGYACALFSRAPIDPEKVKGLTLLTLRQKD
ncbi:MAG: hypothetical protein GY851_13160, partial [bacterium]|nr:hypothetical protein [bacterium]